MSMKKQMSMKIVEKKTCFFSEQKKMSWIKYLFYLVSVHKLIGLPQINLYHTNDIVNEIQSISQYHCIRLYPRTDIIVHYIELMIFCLGESPLKFDIDEEDYFPKWTFDELLKLNITSEQLYTWSASIDLIEDYRLLLVNKTFFNCTDFRFGDRCEYELIVDPMLSFNFSLEEYIQEYYYQFGFNYQITCYVYLECTYRLFSSDCLSWNEICDGKIDCLNGIDEENCLEIEINQCQIDEFRCQNGQCIPLIFHFDRIGIEDCYDGSDEREYHDLLFSRCQLKSGPSFACEEVISSVSVLHKDKKKDRIDKYAELIDIPDRPVLFGQIYFIYHPNLWICYVNNSDFDQFFNQINKKTLINNKICIDSQFIFQSEETFQTKEEFFRYNIMNLEEHLQKYHLPWNYSSIICNQSSMYQCLHTLKCISIDRILNYDVDCPYEDDENLTLILKSKTLLEYLDKTYFKCQTTDKYILQRMINDKYCDCTKDRTIYCEDEDLHIGYLKKTIVFQHICDGFIDMDPLLIDGKFENDETNCEQWNCDNLYTHCNDTWNCPNGIDEMNCPSTRFRCVSIQTYRFINLSIEKINDHIIDCIGGHDEIEYCTSKNQYWGEIFEIYPEFACRKENSIICLSSHRICDGIIDCDDETDEVFCQTNNGPCTHFEIIRSDIEEYICKYTLPRRKWDIIHFTIDNRSTNEIIQKNTLVLKANDEFLPVNKENLCHRGVSVRVWLNNQQNRSRQTCFCPLSYYGPKCQYQNERVTLTVRFRVYADSQRTIFSILILLSEKISHEKFVIHSYEQIQYYSLKDCQKKFAMYLTYLTRPKNRTGQYQIELHFYEIETFTYRGMFIYPLKYSFLPVHRVSLLVDIPNSKETNKYTQQQQLCDCAQDARCFGKTINNRSICICSLNKFGRRCLLDYSKMQKCHNNGLYIARSDQEFICQCRQGFHGPQCEFTEKKIYFQFDPIIDISQSIFIHLIDVTPNEVVRTTLFQTNLFKQQTFSIYWSQSYQLIFIELSNKQYYLTNLIQDTTTHLITQSNRCFNITELFNRNFHQLHLIHKIKSYHLPCQNQSLNISCFYDELHICLCYNFYHRQRLANCFRFDHYTKFDCFGRNQCENNGQCLQDKQDCPTNSMCLCEPCFYGQKCQFKSNGFGLSLDAIIGYQILPDRNFSSQLLSIQLSLGITIVFYLIGCLNSLLSLMTFQNKITRDVGSGIYLFVSSISSLILINLFLSKYLILLLTQMTILSNELFIKVQCYCIDFLLRICLVYNQWLNACVAIERALTVRQGPKFVKSQSQRTAKVLVWLVLSIITCSYIHDPINRGLIIEENNFDETKRIWCIVSYSSPIQIYHYFIHSLHFICPFIINILSAMILILQKTRQQKKTQIKRTFREIFQEELHKLQHLIIGPIVLIILQIPYLLLTFLSKCMKSTDDFWIFLIGYFISFIPSMLTFIIFILPSKFYKKQFQKTLQQCRKYIHCNRFR